MDHAKPTQPTLADYEIMAPVGSRESLAAAIQAGADSIYFGIGRLNMRAHSANTFTIGDLRDIAAECAAHGMRTYLTVNTIIYDEDMDAMREAVDAARQAGITAVIASDVAVMDYCRRVGMEVHLSTQLNISNTEALRFYSRYADVAVLARELRLEQVAEIHRRIREDRDVLPRRAVHGRERQVLHEPRQRRALGQPRRVRADMPPVVHRDRHGDRQPDGD